MRVEFGRTGQFFFGQFQVGMSSLVLKKTGPTFFFGRYRGLLLARCLPTSRWEINGSCQEVTCGEPPAVAHATPLEPESNVTAGTAGAQWRTVRCLAKLRGPYEHLEFLKDFESDSKSDGTPSRQVVRYQCDETFNGTPSATCGYDTWLVLRIFLTTSDWNRFGNSHFCYVCLVALGKIGVCMGLFSLF